MQGQHTFTLSFTLHFLFALAPTKFPDDERFKIYKVYRKMKHTSLLVFQ